MEGISELAIDRLLIFVLLGALLAMIRRQHD